MAYLFNRLGDGYHSPARDVTTNDLEPGAEPGTPTGPKREIEAVEERKRRPQRPTSSTFLKMLNREFPSLGGTTPISAESFEFILLVI